MKTVIEMAREVYGENTHWAGPRWFKRLEQFAELVASQARADAIADEREACARLAEKEAQYTLATAIRGRT